MFYVYVNCIFTSTSFCNDVYVIQFLRLRELYFTCESSAFFPNGCGFNCMKHSIESARISNSPAWFIRRFKQRDGKGGRSLSGIGSSSKAARKRSCFVIQSWRGPETSPNIVPLEYEYVRSWYALTKVDLLTKRYFSTSWHALLSGIGRPTCDVDVQQANVDVKKRRSPTKMT